MPQIITRKSRRWLVVIATVSLACLLIIGWVVMMNLMSSRRYSAVQTRATQLAGNKQYKDEANLLEQYFNSNPPQQYRQKAAAMLGDATYRLGDYHAAYRWYLRAWALEGSKPTLAPVVGVAKSAALIGDTSTAASFYRQAITLVPKSPYEAHQIAVIEYQNDIQGLGAHP